MQRISVKALWAGRVMSALPVLFLIFDGAIKFTKISAVAAALAQLGIPDAWAPYLGTLELVCVAIYVVPQTAVLGALLLTAFLGGAVAMHARLGDPLFTHTLFPVYLGILVWGGLFLREARLRAVIPIRH